MYIINYHNIIADTDYYDYDNHLFARHSVSEFEEQVEFLNKHYNFISLEELINSLIFGNIDPNALSFTFDDAYQGAYQFGLPLLESYNTTAAIFPITSYPGNAPCFEFDKLEIAFRISKQSYLDMSDFNLDIPSEELAGVKENVSLLNNIKTNLKIIPVSTMREYLQKIIDQLEVSKTEIEQYIQVNEKYKPMTWEEITDAQMRGHCIGSHTRHHYSLSQLPLSDMQNEIIASREAIVSKIGDSSWIPFAYPYGKAENLSEQVAQAVKDAGYSCALTTLSGQNHSGHDIFNLRRVELENGKFI